MIPVLRRFDHGQSSKLNCWSYKSADIDGMGHRHDPVDFCEWEIIFVGGEWGRGVHAGQSISGAYLLISQNISKYLGQEPNYVSIVSEFVVSIIVLLLVVPGIYIRSIPALQVVKKGYLISNIPHSTE